MLFLLNDRIVEIAVPEMHLERRWQRIGCGQPHAIRARDVVNFVQARLDQARVSGHEVDEAMAQDLASLIISRTGANSLVLRLHTDGSSEPMLRYIPAEVLETFARGAANDHHQQSRRRKLRAAAH